MVRARRRDRHGRGLRGPALPTTVGAWRSYKDRFADFIAADVEAYRRMLPDHNLAVYDIGIMEVPESDPSPWEDGVPLSRYIPFERPYRLRGRIIFYRLPILNAARRTPHPRLFIHSVVTRQIASVLEVPPESIDYYPFAVE